MFLVNAANILETFFDDIRHIVYSMFQAMKILKKCLIF